MGFEELIQLVIAIAVVLSWLLSGNKSKRERPSEPRQRAPRPRPVPQQRGRASPSAAPEVSTTIILRPGSVPRPDETMAEEIYRILSQEVERREVEESVEIREAGGASLEIERVEAAPERGTLEETALPEAYSLETLEPAGGESHRRFHETYVAPQQPAASTEPVRPRVRRLVATPRTLREAIIWREVLGPPKGLA